MPASSMYVRKEVEVTPPGVWLASFNFATNQEDLHITHRAWLEREVRPLLKSGFRVYLGGCASRSGGYYYNQPLSMRRMEAVRRYLQPEIGLVSGDMENLSTSHCIGNADNDPLDRAVLVVVPQTAPKPWGNIPGQVEIDEREITLPDSPLVTAGWQFCNSEGVGIPPESGSWQVLTAVFCISKRVQIRLAQPTSTSFGTGRWAQVAAWVCLRQ